MTAMTMTINKRQKAKGFTLLEVMMALVIFTILALATHKATSQSIDQYYRVKMRTFANWIAENKMAQMRLAGAMPAAREYKEDISYANMKWRLKTQVTKTADPDMLRVDIKIFNVLGDGLSDGSGELQAGSFSGVIGKN